MRRNDGSVRGIIQRNGTKERRKNGLLLYGVNKASKGADKANESNDDGREELEPADFHVKSTALFFIDQASNKRPAVYGEYHSAVIMVPHLKVFSIGKLSIKF